MADTIQTFINDTLRPDFDDEGIEQGNTWDGDGSTIIFRVTEFPILESSFVVSIGGVDKVENTNYTINLKTGVVTFVIAPDSGNDNVKIEYKSVKKTDGDWLKFVKRAVEFFGEKIFTDELKEDLASVANQLLYDGEDGMFKLIAVWARPSTSSSDADWQDLSSASNISYYKEPNQLRISPTFSDDVNTIRYRFLKRVTAVADLTDEISWNRKFDGVYGAKSAQFYFENLASSKFGQTAIVTKERTYLPATSMLRIAQYWNDQAKDLLKPIRPRIPAVTIRNQVAGIND